MNAPTLGVIDRYRETGGRGMPSPGPSMCSAGMAQGCGYGLMGNAWDSRHSYMGAGWEVVPKGEPMMEGDMGFYEHYGRRGGQGWIHGHIVTVMEGADGKPQALSYLNGKWQPHSLKPPQLTLRYTGGSAGAPAAPSRASGRAASTPPPSSRPSARSMRERLSPEAIRAQALRDAQAEILQKAQSAVSPWR